MNNQDNNQAREYKAIKRDNVLRVGDQVTYKDEPDQGEVCYLTEDGFGVWWDNSSQPIHYKWEYYGKMKALCQFITSGSALTQEAKFEQMGPSDVRQQAIESIASKAFKDEANTPSGKQESLQIIAEKWRDLAKARGQEIERLKIQARELAQSNLNLRSENQSLIQKIGG